MNTYTTVPTPGHGAPESFLTTFGQKITGVLSAFDRCFSAEVCVCCFSPTRWSPIWPPAGFGSRTSACFEKITKQVNALAYAAADTQGRPVQYLNGPGISKEELARQIARRDGVQSRLIALFTVVEPCWSYLRGAG